MMELLQNEQQEKCNVYRFGSAYDAGCDRVDVFGYALVFK